MKKQTLAAVLAALLLVGCGGDTTTEPETPTQPETGITAEEMKEELEAFPAEVTAEDAVAAGCYTITADGVAGGQADWDAFLAAAQEGQEVSIILCQYTERGGAVLDYLLHQAEGGYLIVSDSSRDGYSEDETVGEDYETLLFADLKIFEHFSVEEGADSYTIGVLTNEADLDADSFRTYWNEGVAGAHEAYLLFSYKDGGAAE